MILLKNKQNVTAPDATFPFGDVKDNTGASDGTPLDRAVLSDYIQFFAKMFDASGLLENGLLENDVNGFQYFDALAKTINNNNSAGIIETESQSILKTKVIDIGDWDMNTDETVTVIHGLSDHKKVRSVNVIIRDDNDAGYHDIGNQTSGQIDGGVVIINSTQIIIGRITGRGFDNALFDSIPFNRGFIQFTHEV